MHFIYTVCTVRTVLHVEPCSVPCGGLGEWGWGGMDACINMCMAESLPCSPGTVTTLLISYTPRQNTKFKRKTSGGGSIRDISKQCLYSRL